MKQETIDSFRQSESTKEVLKFFDDYIGWLTDCHCDADYEGKTAHEISRKQAELSGMRFLIDKIRNLNFDDVKEFYNQFEEENGV